MSQSREPHVLLQPILIFVAMESLAMGLSATFRPAFLTSEVLLCLVTANLAGLLSWRCRKHARTPLKRGEEALIAFAFLIFLGHRLASSDFGKHLLLNMTRKDNYGAVHLLLTLSAPRNSVAPGISSTPLNAALLAQNMEMARLLLEAGADPNRRDRSEWTPMETARITGNDQVISLLHRYGALESAVHNRPEQRKRHFTDNDLVSLELRQESHGHP